MPTNKLTIVPIKLDPITNEATSINSPEYSSAPSCVIKTATVEISFFNGVLEGLSLQQPKAIAKSAKGVF